MQHRGALRRDWRDGLSGQPCGTDEEATDEEAPGEDCHILPLTGLNAFVYTGLNAQKL